MVTEIMLWVVGLLVLVSVLSWLPFPIKEWLGKTVAKVRSLFSGLFAAPPVDDGELVTRSIIDDIEKELLTREIALDIPPDVAVCLSLLRETSNLAERLKEAGMVTAHKAMGTVAKRMAEVTAAKLAEVIVGFESED